MKIIIGSDHAGFRYKEKIKEILRFAQNDGKICHSEQSEESLDVLDIGTHSEESCDYPAIAREAALKIASGEADRAILVCGTGQGMAMAANRIAGIRAAVCGDTFSARASRTHNDANILCIGARVTGEGLMLEIVDTWLNTEFEDGRHTRRVEMIDG